MTDALLRELAQLYGIQLTYEDAAGKTRRATPEQLRAILRVRIPDGMSFDEALEFRREHPPQPNHELLQAAPKRAPRPKEKTWGIFAPIYAMHSPHLGEMQRYQEWVQELGGGFVATLPLNALDDDERSPYAPTSRLFWNEMYLDVERLPEYRGEPIGDKRALLEKLAERWQPGEVDELTRQYADFRCGSGFSPTERAEARPTSGKYHVYVQTRMSDQMRELKAMYLDFPLGVKAGGFDHTHFADQFANGVTVGAPPDLFFTKGQNWGFPPLDPDAIRKHEHSYFRACIRKALQHASILRIDHVMGLHRLFWIPEGAEPKDGVYVRYPADELYAILLIESHASGSLIVGEDLGTVPKYVPQAMNRYGIRRMYVVQYELPKLEPPAKESIASINTHDMPTFAGFWEGKDIDERLEQKLLDESGAAEERKKRGEIRELVINFLKARGLLGERESEKMAVLEGLLRWLASSDAEFVLVNLEDCWLEEEPQNRPSEPDRSWRQKMKKSLEEARNDEAVRRLLAAVNASRKGTHGNET